MTVRASGHAAAARRTPAKGLTWQTLMPGAGPTPAQSPAAGGPRWRSDHHGATSIRTPRRGGRPPTWPAHRAERDALTARPSRPPPPSPPTTPAPGLRGPCVVWGTRRGQRSASRRAGRRDGRAVTTSPVLPPPPTPVLGPTDRVPVQDETACVLPHHPDPDSHGPCAIPGRDGVTAGRSRPHPPSPTSPGSHRPCALRGRSRVTGEPVRPHPPSPHSSLRSPRAVCCSGAWRG